MSKTVLMKLMEWVEENKINGFSHDEGLGRQPAHIDHADLTAKIAELMNEEREMIETAFNAGSDYGKEYVLEVKGFISQSACDCPDFEQYYADTYQTSK